jgi:predicted glycoside hydrolase/deacetylase ChbG (UPF0249 family)
MTEFRCAWDGCRGCHACTVQPKIDEATEDLRQELALAQRHEREWKSAAADLQGRLEAMKRAASSAAATTVTAIERIQEMEKVVKAAEAWVKAGSHAALVDAVNAWQKLKESWS